MKPNKKIKLSSQKSGWHLFKIGADRVAEARAVYIRGKLCNDFAMFRDYGYTSGLDHKPEYPSELYRALHNVSAGEFKIKNGILTASLNWGGNAEEAIINYLKYFVETDGASTGWSEEKYTDSIKSGFEYIKNLCKITSYLRWDSWDLIQTIKRSRKLSRDLPP
jgi:hypothetical protein